MTGEPVRVQVGVEEAVKAIWRQVLQVSGVEIDDNLFDAGGTSIAAMRIASRLSETFHIQVSMDTILRDATVGSVARAVEEMLADAAQANR